MKKLIATILVFALMALLCSCGTPSLQPNQNANSINDNTDSNTEKITSPASKVVELNSAFNVGDTMNITLTSSEWCEEIKPSNTSGVYSYYEDISGEKYFVVHGELKNLASETLDITYAGEAEIKINDKYKLPARMEMEEPDGSSFYGNAKPLQTLRLIIYSSISDELYENCNSIKLTMNLVTDNEKIGNFYNDDYQHETFEITFNK